MSLRLTLEWQLHNNNEGDGISQNPKKQEFLQVLGRLSLFHKYFSKESGSVEFESADWLKSDLGYVIDFMSKSMDDFK